MGEKRKSADDAVDEILRDAERVNHAIEDVGEAPERLADHLAEDEAQAHAHRAAGPATGADRKLEVIVEEAVKDVDACETADPESPAKGEKGGKGK